jgi:uncharacterized protein YbgA (DUF1722 family)/uncharacterized protein YbbK (DUF523 family)
MSPEPDSDIRIGISACLLGEKVRFDSNHKRDDYILNNLSRFFRFVPVCPELAIGLGVPREPIHLVGDAVSPRAIGARTPSLDVTDALTRLGTCMAHEMSDISGYIVKSRSPSCGMERVKVYRHGQSSLHGSGLYTRAFMRARPLVPVEEEGRLTDPILRENFIERVFAYRRWQALLVHSLTPARLVGFHTAHKLILMSHGTTHCRALGRLVAGAGKGPVKTRADEYIHDFMIALGYRATRKRHTNVLIHLMGYLKKHLHADDKAELLQLIDNYRLGEVPLIVPITLLKHHFRHHPHPYIESQLYLSPHPPELMLRNEI